MINKNCSRILLLVFLLIVVQLISFQDKFLFNNAYSLEPLFMAGEQQKAVNVPIIMYHRITVCASNKNKFEISPANLEVDFKYLKNNGYETVVIKDLIDFVNRGRPLPEKPIVLTFDDGNYSDYHYVYPLLKKYQIKAVLSLLGKPIDTYSSEGRKDINYPNLVWPQITEMLDDGAIEIQSHSYNLHGARGSSKRKSEGIEEYQERLKEDLQKMQLRVKEMTGSSPAVFTYPFGNISKESFAVLKELGFLGSLTCYEGLNTIEQGKPEGLFLLKRFNRTNKRPIKIISKEFDTSSGC